MTTATIADTWAGVLPAGLAGALVSGAATVIAVWLTIRHTRSTRLDDAVDRANASCGVFLLGLLAGESKPGELATHGDALQQLASVVTIASRDAPQLALLLTKLMQHDLSEATRTLDESEESKLRFLLAMASVQVVLGLWISDRRAITSGRLGVEEVRAITQEARSDPMHESATAKRIATAPHRWFGLRRSAR